jgi:hypothetical protein
MVGILVHGDNHFIVRGPKPDVETARALVRQWSVIQIGGSMLPELQGWRISTKEFREELEWAIVVGDDGDMSAAVRQLLDEMAERGVEVGRV